MTAILENIHVYTVLGVLKIPGPNKATCQTSLLAVRDAGVQRFAPSKFDVAEVEATPEDIATDRGSLVLSLKAKWTFSVRCRNLATAYAEN